MEEEVEEEEEEEEEHEDEEGPVSAAQLMGHSGTGHVNHLYAGTCLLYLQINSKKTASQIYKMVK